MLGVGVGDWLKRKNCMKGECIISRSVIKTLWEDGVAIEDGGGTDDVRAIKHKVCIERHDELKIKIPLMILI